jgi:hypothetical protein
VARVHEVAVGDVSQVLRRTDAALGSPVSVGALGSLNDHSGPCRAAEEHAARVFGADLTYFRSTAARQARNHPAVGRDRWRRRAG